ncbi:MAG: OsmC family protein [Pseudomonadales bacterium]|nr:OsmC family protein [Pseudomonadales bacterium]
MSNYSATVQWQRDGADFLNKEYSRAHCWRFNGGSLINASASSHIVPEPFSKPEFVDPEEAFVAALSSCHMLFFLDLAAQDGFVVDAYDDEALGVMSKNADGKIAMTRVELNPKVKFHNSAAPTQEQIESLHHRSHELCFIANSVKSDVIVTPR